MATKHITSRLFLGAPFRSDLHPFTPSSSSPSSSYIFSADTPALPPTDFILSLPLNRPPSPEQLHQTSLPTKSPDESTDAHAHSLTYSYIDSQTQTQTQAHSTDSCPPLPTCHFDPARLTPLSAIVPPTPTEPQLHPHIRPQPQAKIVHRVDLLAFVLDLTPCRTITLATGPSAGRPQMIANLTLLDGALRPFPVTLWAGLASHCPPAAAEEDSSGGPQIDGTKVRIGDIVHLPNVLVRQHNGQPHGTCSSSSPAHRLQICYRTSPAPPTSLNTVSESRMLQNLNNPQVSQLMHNHKQIHSAQYLRWDLALASGQPHLLAVRRLLLALEAAGAFHPAP